MNAPSPCHLTSSQWSTLKSPLHAIAELKPGDHICSLYDTEEEHRAFLSPFLFQGLERGEKVLYLAHNHTTERVLDYLWAQVSELDSYLARGQLSVLATADVYLREGVFDPARMIGLLRAETDRALAEGYSGLRVTGEMTWALSQSPGAERLIEYEARLNDFFPGSKCLALCQYDRRRFPPATLLNVLSTHPLAVIGTEIYDNFYYMPPEEFLGQDVPASLLRHRLQHLAERKKVETDLRRARDEWAATFNCLSDPVTIHDADHNILLRNQAFALAFPSRDGERTKCYQLVHGLDAPPPQCPLVKAIASQKGEISEFFEPWLGRYLSVSTDPIVEGGGEIERAVHIIRDVTERKRAEEELEMRVLERTAELARANKALEAEIAERQQAEAALRQSETRYHSLFEDSPLSLWVEDFSQVKAYLDRLCAEKPDACEAGFKHHPEAVAHCATLVRVLDVNRATLELYRAGNKEIFLAGLPELFSEEGYEAFRQELVAICRGETACETESVIQTMTGESRHVVVKWSVAPGCDRTLERVLVSVIDITDRKRAAEALRASEEQTRLLLDSTAEAIYGQDPQGRCTFCNPACLRLLGFTGAGELLGKDMHALIHHTRPDGTPYPLNECAVHRAIQTGEGSHTDKEVLWRADGTSFPVECWSFPVRRGTELVGAVVTFWDISERKALEEQFRQAQKMEAVGRLAGGVAHDFNNLLMVIRGYSELLVDRFSEDDPRLKMAVEIRDAADRAASVIKQLLAFSRKQVMQPAVLELNTVVTRMEKMLQRLIGEDIELVSHLAPSPGQVRADPGQLEQVIMNLAVNARDAMPQGGRLTLETRKVELDESYARHHAGVSPGPYVMLAVSDTGRGMDKETQARIFEPFFTTKEKDKGTGLGLATVYGIVKQSGGHIWVYSEVGRGTSFKVYLPRIEETSVAAPLEVFPAALPLGTETVLLVEDAEPLRKLAREFLELSGYAVLEASNGAEALEIAAQHSGPIQLLMTDVVMPGMSGRELSVRLASHRPEMKVLYISGYTDNTILQHGVLDPGIAFLQKPFSLRSLAQKLRQVLDSAPGPRS